MSSRAGPSGRRTGRVALTVLALGAFAVLAGLGVWQVKRLQWKESLIAAIDERIASKPVALAEIERRLADPDGIEYRPVTVSGTFDHAGEAYFFTTHKGRTGYYVYTPLMLADGRALFVNRGFVPYDNKDPATRPQGQVEGEVTVTGLARTAIAEKPSSLIPDNDLEKNIFYWKDLSDMAALAGFGTDASVVRLFIDADDTPNPGGLPMGGVTIIDLPNNHLQYAITWFGLAAALAGVFGAWLWRERAQSP
ncbi:MAG: SURF1 family protein [Rhizobiaceae bacterium]